DNVMVLDEPPGRDLVKVLDFGLAKQLDDTNAKVTSHGVVVGTPRYMAPETSTGGAMSPAADVYALGVMIAELATAASPCHSEHLAELLSLKLSPRAAFVHVPTALHAIVMRLVDPSPEARPTAAETRALLAGLATPSVQGRRPALRDVPQEASTIAD